MKAYSMDLRERVLADCDAGLRTGPVAHKYAVSPRWVRLIKRRRRLTGEVAPRVRASRPPKLSAHRERLRALVQEKPDRTLAELRDRLGVDCALSVLWRELRRLRLSFKKRRSSPPNSSGPMSRSGARRGGRSRRAGRSGGSSSSTRPGPRRI